MELEKSPTETPHEVNLDTGAEAEATSEVAGDGERRLPGVSTDAHLVHASNLLVRSGAQFIEEALRDNPDGPVRMGIEISKTEVEYDVTIGFPDDRHKARTIWHKTVRFGASDRHCAGGAAFVEAGREQDAVAFAALELLESHR